MPYIDPLQLIRVIMRQQPIDAQHVLSTVDRSAVVRALRKTKTGVPRSFKWSDAPMEEEHLARMPESEKEHLWELLEDISEQPTQALPDLLALQKRYPEVPSIYNYIAVAYACSQQQAKYLHMLQETVTRFPDYLFGKISLAEYALNHGDYRKVSAILDKKFEIYDHYPADVETFHLSEARSFYGVVGRYFIRCNKQARALFCYFTLEELDPEHWMTKQVADEIIQQEIERLRNDRAPSSEHITKQKPRKGTRRKKRR
jgi:hypothetical protein